MRVDVEVAACESSLSSLESVQDISRLHSVAIDYDKSGFSRRGNILNECPSDDSFENLIVVAVNTERSASFLLVCCE